MLCAFDGTWNTVKDKDERRHTNVWKFYQAYQANNHNEWDFYWPGVGTRLGVLGRTFGGVWGAGALPRLNEAYDRVCAAWDAGDRIIDVVGFSRGAAIALDFCNILQERKICRPRTDDVVCAEPPIRFLGLWDTVGAFGLANLGGTHLNFGHQLHLPKANLRYAFQALALDERRPSFLPTRLSGACEVWFRGVHSDVGGGNGNTGLNDIALRWMLSKALGAGLPITPADLARLKPDPAAPVSVNTRLKLDIRLVGSLDRCHYSVAARRGCRMPPETCRLETPEDEAVARELAADALTYLTDLDRARIAALTERAERTAQALEFELTDSRQAFTTLLQGRIPLVSDEEKLQQAGAATEQLIRTAVQGAQRRGFHRLNEFFLNEALFRLRPLFPFTD